MRTETTLLEGDRARLDVEVPAERVEHDLQHTLGHLAHQVRVPGFRKGRVPPAVVLQRLGREEVLDETLREHLERWYADARQREPHQADRAARHRLEGAARRGRAVPLLGDRRAAAEGHAARSARDRGARATTTPCPTSSSSASSSSLRKEGSPLVAVERSRRPGRRLRRARLPRSRRRRQRAPGRVARGLPRRARRRPHPPADGAGRRRHARRASRRRSTSTSRPTTPRRAWPARPRPSTCTCGAVEQRELAAARRRARAHGSPSSTRSPSCAPTSSA